MSAPDYWNDAIRALSACDPTLKQLIDQYQGETLYLRDNSFYTLARAIAGQQISVKAADSVWKRIEEGLKGISPTAFAGAGEDTLRSFGLSRQKVRYLHALADYFLHNPEKVKAWPELEDDVLIQELVMLKGIGRWTAEMALIFHFGRANVFPIDDIGLQKAMFRYYYHTEKVPLTVLKQKAEAWQPYRSCATWYLWRALDPLPVAY